MGAVHKVCSLQLDPNFGVPSEVNKKFYLRLTIEKMRPFKAFNKKYLRLYDFSGTNFTAVVNSTNPKTKIQGKIIEIQIIQMHI